MTPCNQAELKAVIKTLSSPSKLLSDKAHKRLNQAVNRFFRSNGKC